MYDKIWSKIYEIATVTNNNADYVRSLAKKTNRIACGCVAIGVSVVLLYATLDRISNEICYLQNKVYNMEKEIEEM